jgi:hypothetical protein
MRGSRFSFAPGSNRVLLKTMTDAALLHNGIGRMTGFDFTVNGHMAIGYRAVPNIVIALSSPLEITAVLL